MGIPEIIICRILRLMFYNPIHWPLVWTSSSLHPNTYQVNRKGRLYMKTTRSQSGGPGTAAPARMRHLQEASLLLPLPGAGFCGVVDEDPAAEQPVTLVQTCLNEHVLQNQA